MKKSIIFFLGIMLLGCQRQVLTEEERAWIARHPVIRLAPDPDFPPFEFFNRFGQYEGIGADFVREFSRWTGIRIEVDRYSNWSEVLHALSNRQIDMINCAIDTPARRAYALFPTPYLSLPNVVITRKTMAEEVTFEGILPLKVGMVRGYGMVDILKEQYPDFSPVLYPTLFDGFRALMNEEVDYFLSDIGTASYYITEGGFYSLKIISSFKPDNVMGFGVRSDWPVLVRIIEKFQASMQESEKQRILRKWIIIGQKYLVIQRQNWLVWGTVIFLGVALGVIGGIFWRIRLHEPEQKRREEKLVRELTEMATMLPVVLERFPIGAMIVEKDGEVSYVNSVFVDIFGFTKEELKSFYDFYQTTPVQESNRKLLWEKWESVVTYRRKNPYVLLEHFLFTDKEGREHPCRMDIHRLGEKYLLTFVDYHEKETRNREAEYKQNQFRLMMKEKDMLFTELEHRVRNTLQMVLSFCRLHTPLVSLYTSEQLLWKLSFGIDLLAIVQNYTMEDLSLRLYRVKVPLMEFLYQLKTKHGIEVETDIDEVELNGQSLLALLFCVEEILALGYCFWKKEGRWKVSLKHKKMVFLGIESDQAVDVSEEKMVVCRGFVSQLGGKLSYSSAPHFVVQIELELGSLQRL